MPLEEVEHFQEKLRSRTYPATETVSTFTLLALQKGCALDMETFEILLQALYRCPQVLLRPPRSPQSEQMAVHGLLEIPGWRARAVIANWSRSPVKGTSSSTGECPLEIFTAVLVCSETF